MTVSVVLITHEEIGTALLNTASRTFAGELPLATTAVAVSYDIDPDELLTKLKRLAHTVESEDGLLVLTDMYGSTPCNIALSLQETDNIEVVTGLNLPMLIRVMNYPQLPLAELAQKAISGGKEGVIECKCQSK